MQAIGDSWCSLLWLHVYLVTWLQVVGVVLPVVVWVCCRVVVLHVADLVEWSVVTMYMLSSCSSIIATAQACVKVVVGSCTTAVATLLLHYMLSLCTGSIRKSVAALCRSICT